MCFKPPAFPWAPERGTAACTRRRRVCVRVLGCCGAQMRTIEVWWVSSCLTTATWISKVNAPPGSLRTHRLAPHAPARSARTGSLRTHRLPPHAPARSARTGSLRTHRLAPHARTPARPHIRLLSPFAPPCPPHPCLSEPRGPHCAADPGAHLHARRGGGGHPARDCSRRRRLWVHGGQWRRGSSPQTQGARGRRPPGRRGCVSSGCKLPLPRASCRAHDPMAARVWGHAFLCVSVCAGVCRRVPPAAAASSLARPAPVPHQCSKHTLHSFQPTATQWLLAAHSPRKKPPIPHFHFPPRAKPRPTLCGARRTSNRRGGVPHVYSSSTAGARAVIVNRISPSSRAMNSPTTRTASCTRGRRVAAARKWGCGVGRTKGRKTPGAHARANNACTHGDEGLRC